MKLSTAQLILEAPENWKVWVLSKQIAFLSPQDEKPSREIIFTLSTDGVVLYKDYYQSGEFHRNDGPAITVYDSEGNAIEYLYYEHGKILKKVILDR